MEEVASILYSKFKERNFEELKSLGGSELLALMKARNIFETFPDRSEKHIERICAIEQQLSAARAEFEKDVSMVKKSKEFYENKKEAFITDEIVEEVLGLDEFEDEESALADMDEEEEEEEEEEEDDPFDQKKISEITEQMIRDDPPPLVKMMNQTTTAEPRKRMKIHPSFQSSPYTGRAESLCLYCGEEEDCACVCFQCKKPRSRCSHEHFFISEAVANAFQNMCEQAENPSKKSGANNAIGEWRRAIAFEFQQCRFSEKKEKIREFFTKSPALTCVVCLRDKEERGGVCRQCKAVAPAKK